MHLRPNTHMRRLRRQTAVCAAQPVRSLRIDFRCRSCQRRRSAPGRLDCHRTTAQPSSHPEAHARRDCQSFWRVVCSPGTTGIDIQPQPPRHVGWLGFPDVRWGIHSDLQHGGGGGLHSTLSGRTIPRWAAGSQARTCGGQPDLGGRATMVDGEDPQDASKRCPGLPPAVPGHPSFSSLLFFVRLRLCLATTSLTIAKCTSSFTLFR